MVSSSTDSRITAPMNQTSRSEIRSDMSMNIAVCPPTWTWAPGASANASGMTSSRSRWTRSVVASSCGAEVGTTRSTAAVPPSLGWIGDTA
jgi:hypothetical protein